LQVDIKGKKINYEVEGDGQAVILLHGWLANLETMKPIARYLVNNFKVYSVDIIGFGKSDEPDEPMHADDYGNFVKDFVETLNIENPIIIGHSNGGRAAINAVGRKLINCKKLILIDSAGIKNKKTLKGMFKVGIYKLGKVILNIMPKTKYIEASKKEYMSSAGSDDYKASSPVLKKTMVNILKEDQSENCKKIDCPTLLIWGEKDTATQLWQAKKMEKLIPNAGLVSYPNAGHFSYIDNLTEVEAVIKNFLTEDKK